MNKQNPKIAAIIVNWNNPIYTVGAIRSLKQNNYNELTMIIADNGSTDNSIKFIQEKEPSIKIIDIGANLGYGSAINYVYDSLDTKEYDFLLILNNDIEFDRCYLEKLVETLTKFGPKHIIGSKIMYMSDKSKIWYLGGEVGPGAFQIKHSFIRNDDFNISEPFTTDYITGCSMMLHIEDFAQLRFDESFKMYGEDVDICLRASAIGFKCIVEPRSIAFHAISASYSGNFSIKKNIMKFIARIKVVYRNAIGAYN